MAGYRTASTNFTKGWISPEAEARFELPVYNAAVRKALNVKVERTGGLKKRMGTRFVAEALSSSARLIPFQFSDTQAYVLEFGQAKMRPFAFGGAVLETGLKVTAITKAVNAQITCAHHGYSVGDQVYFTSIGGMVEINDRFLTVLTATTNTFTVNFNSTNASTFTGDTGQVNSADPSPPPTPPPVPTPTPTPTPPPTTSGGGDPPPPDDGDDGYRCVTIESLLLLANPAGDGPGGEMLAGRALVGDILWTRDEHTLLWRAARITAIRFADEEAVALRGHPDATPRHRFGLPLWLARLLPPRLRWYRAGWFGRPVGIRTVAKITTEAGTYMARHPAPGSKWRWSHNIKNGGI